MLTYHEGNGDALLVATALYEKRKELDKLFQDEWIIVTDDKGLKKFAKKFAIECIDNSSFMGILEQKING